MRADLLQQLALRSAGRLHSGLLRRLQTVEPVRGPRVRVEGRELLGFCSNDYLGLADHPDVIAALAAGARRDGVGSTAAHLICGHRGVHAELERALAEWTGREAALLFTSGVMANLGVMQALLHKGDVCVQDRLNHASLIDAARASGARLLRYPHADVEAASRQLCTLPDAAAMLATDGVFSMDGDLAPLAPLAALCARERASLMVDDAHGLGVLGDQGAGSIAAAGLSQADVPVLMGTLGKALGCAGAFVAGSAELIDGLIQFARSYIYTTAMPSALAAAGTTALDLARTEDWRRHKLRELIARFRLGAQQLNLPLLDSSTPIQPLMVGDAERASAICAGLRKCGLLVVAIRPPTVAAGQARLRITLSAAHEDADIDRLLDALAVTIRP